MVLEIGKGVLGVNRAQVEFAFASLAYSRNGTMSECEDRFDGTIVYGLFDEGFRRVRPELIVRARHGKNAATIEMPQSVYGKGEEKKKAHPCAK